MKGIVTKLCDIDSIEIPQEMLDIRVDEQQVEAELQALSLRYASEEQADVAEQGDTVVCQADRESYPDGRTILLYTAVPMPGAADAVQAALGKKAGDTFTAPLAGKTVTLTVEKIIRRTPVEVNDALIAGLGMDGVSTVADYRNYLRNKAMDEQKMEQSKAIIRYFLEQMEQGSSFEYDQKELDAYVQKNMEQYLQDMQEMGMEESPEEIKNSILMQEKQNWMAQAFCESHNIPVDTADAEAQADQMLEMMQLTGETAPDRAEMVEMILQGAYIDGVIQYINAIIEKKMGGSHGNA